MEDGNTWVDTFKNVESKDLSEYSGLKRWSTLLLKASTFVVPKFVLVLACITKYHCKSKANELAWSDSSESFHDLQIVKRGRDSSYYKATDTIKVGLHLKSSFIHNHPELPLYLQTWSLSGRTCICESGST